MFDNRRRGARLKRRVNKNALEQRDISQPVRQSYITWAKLWHRRTFWWIPPYTSTVLRPFFPDHLGQPVPEENFWTLWCKGRLTEADTPTIRLGATPSGLSRAWWIEAHITPNHGWICEISGATAGLWDRRLSRQMTTQLHFW